eukprot:scaffold69795_cov58-Phaeocystis_antarctica.AAC.3
MSSPGSALVIAMMVGRGGTPLFAALLGPDWIRTRGRAPSSSSRPRVPPCFKTANKVGRGLRERRRDTELVRPKKTRITSKNVPFKTNLSDPGVHHTLGRGRRGRLDGAGRQPELGMTLLSRAWASKIRPALPPGVLV